MLLSLLSSLLAALHVVVLCLFHFCFARDGAGHAVCPLLQAKKLEAEVLAPMQRWTTAYNTVQARMNKLEGVRLEVDSRRRTVAELGQKIDKQRARLPQTKSKGEFDIEQTIKRVQHKENKLAGLLSVTAQLHVQCGNLCTKA